MLTRDAFIWSSKNSHLKLLFSTWKHLKMYSFIPVMNKLFLKHFHDPSEIILIRWFGAEEMFIIIIIITLLNISVETVIQ